mmetsp:Transcript_83408/g.131716  ORF Transcript_83408/g.131716 Transcript_83408/m.131716 type:complete len:763 (+) Transcript_83408:105-2393(+)
MEEAYLDSQHTSLDVRRGSRRLPAERYAEATDHMLSGVKERPKRKNFQPEATGQQASDFLAPHPAKQMLRRPSASFAGTNLVPTTMGGCILGSKHHARPSSCTLGRFPTEAPMSARRAAPRTVPAGAQADSKDLRSHLEHCEQLLERVEAEVYERERQLAGICADVSSKGPDTEVPYVAEMYETTSELSELRAELHERDKQLRGLQEEIGRAFNDMLPDMVEGASPLPVLPPPERSSLASAAKGSLGVLGDMNQKSSMVCTELPAPSLAASGDAPVVSAAAMERVACLEQLAALISANTPSSHDSHHIAPMSARLPGSRQGGLGHLPSAKSHDVQVLWEDLERILYDVQTARSSATAVASSAPSTNGKSDSARRKRLPSAPSSVEDYSRLNGSPPKPRGSYINAGGQVYWLNYEEPMDLQRLPSSRAVGISGGSAAAPSRPSREVASSRRSASAGCRGRILWDTGATADSCSRKEFPASDSEWSEEEPPSPSPDEPLLPETPQLATQRHTRPESVPRLGLAEQSNLRLGRAASAVWQRPSFLREEYSSTPRLVCHSSHSRGALQRSGSMTGTTGLASCSSLRAPSTTTTTPRRQSSLVRRQLSAPRLMSSSGVHCASHDCITPRSISPRPKALGHHLGQQPFVPRLHQLGKVPPSVQLRAEQPLSGRGAVSTAQTGSQAIGSIPQRSAAPPLMMPMFLSSTSPRCTPAAMPTSSSRGIDQRLPTADGRTSPRPPCIKTLPGPPRCTSTIAAQAQAVNWGILQ